MDLPGERLCWARASAAVVVALSPWSWVASSATRLPVSARCCDNALRQEPGVAAPEARIVSVEVDPVHAVVARHFLDLVHLAVVVEVQPGFVRDVLPLCGEAFGWQALGLGFMDQKGTAFHADHALLRGLRAWQPGAGAGCVADNVLRPGAPVYVWSLAQMASGSDARVSSPTSAAVFWSLPEFLEESDGVEDWMALEDAPGARQY